MPSGLSFAEVLAIERVVRNRRDPPPLSRKQILDWADAHRRRAGDWPQVASGPMVDAPGETWVNVNAALKKGTRGLQGGSSLARLLAIHHGKRHHHEQPALTYKLILAGADGHRPRTGKWPNKASSAVQDAPGAPWRYLDDALRRGGRGLPSGTTLLRLLARKRGVPIPAALPPLTEELILRWAERHREVVGTW